MRRFFKLDIGLVLSHADPPLRTQLRHLKCKPLKFDIQNDELVLMVHPDALPKSRQKAAFGSSVRRACRVLHDVRPLFFVRQPPCGCV